MGVGGNKTIAKQNTDMLDIEAVEEVFEVKGTKQQGNENIEKARERAGRL